jgi:hypothetical protein
MPTTMLTLRACFVLTVAALLICAAGCKKSKPGSADQTVPASEQTAAEKSPPVAENKGPAPLRGAAEVMAALQRKDYSGAVAALTQAKAGMTSDQRLEYNELLRKVRGELATAASTDESAKRAFDALRQIESGR